MLRGPTNWAVARKSREKRHRVGGSPTPIAEPAFPAVLGLPEADLLCRREPIAPFFYFIF